MRMRRGCGPDAGGGRVRPLGVAASALALAVAAFAPASGHAATTSLHVSQLEALPGASVRIHAVIDGARDGDTIRFFGVRLAVADDATGGVAAERVEARRVVLAPPTVTTGDGALFSSTEVVVERGLHVFIASYRRRGRVIARRSSLVDVAGPIERPLLFDGVARNPDAVTGYDLQSLRAGLRGESRDRDRRAGAARAAAADRTTAFRIVPPQGRYRGKKPKGMVVIVHGGGWYGGGPADRSSYSRLAGRAYLDSIELSERRWNRRGYLTLNVDYHSGFSSRSDVTRLVDAARRTRPDLRICFYGESAGGNLSLLSAGGSTLRRHVACVVSAAGPANLLALPDVPDGRTPHLCDFSISSTYVRCLSEGWFGSAYLARWSPFNRPAARRIFVAEAANDEIVPPSQGASLRRKLGRRRVTHLVLGRPRSDDHIDFLHGTTTSSERRRYFKAERAFVDRATRKRSRR